MSSNVNDLQQLINLMVERRVREADVSDGARVRFGSRNHVSDLKKRIADLVQWRDRQKRGSEARANYSRLISKLKSELKAAARAAVQGR